MTRNCAILRNLSYRVASNSEIGNLFEFSKMPGQCGIKQSGGGFVVGVGSAFGFGDGVVDAA